VNHRYSDVLRNVFDSLTCESEWRLFFARSFKNVEKNKPMKTSTVDMSWKPAKMRIGFAYCENTCRDESHGFCSYPCDGASKRMHNGILLDVHCTVGTQQIYKMRWMVGFMCVYNFDAIFILVCPRIRTADAIFLFS